MPKILRKPSTRSMTNFLIKKACSVIKVKITLKEYPGIMKMLNELLTTGEVFPQPSTAYKSRQT